MNKKMNIENRRFIKKPIADEIVKVYYPMNGISYGKVICVEEMEISDRIYKKREKVVLEPLFEYKGYADFYLYDYKVHFISNPKIIYLPYKKVGYGSGLTD